MSTTDEILTTPPPGKSDPMTQGRAEVEDSSSIETIIRPMPGWIAINWRELIQSHELFSTLIIRDLKVRYKQTVLGVAWAVIQPLFQMIVFAVIFGRMAGFKSGDVPYPLFVLAGTVPWTFFSNAVTGAASSLLAQQAMLTKIYFPRLYVPTAIVGGFLVDMAIGLFLFLILMPFYHQTPGWGLLALPFVVALCFFAALGLGLVLAAATLLYRDLRFVVPFALSILMFLSPVIYSADRIPAKYWYLAALNPMFGIIHAFRSSILGEPWYFGALSMAILSTAALMVFGLFFFRKTERMIADIA